MLGIFQRDIYPKMDEFFAGIGSHMTSTQICDVCYCSIHYVTHNIDPLTKENAVLNT